MTTKKLSHKYSQSTIQPGTEHNTCRDIDIGKGEWVRGGIGMGQESELSLQEKIIHLYERIEEKTIGNIDLKKNNEIVRAQIQAYRDIIAKIENSSHCSQIQKTRRESEAPEQEDKTERHYQYREYTLEQRDYQASNNDTEQYPPVRKYGGASGKEYRNRRRSADEVELQYKNTQTTRFTSSISKRNSCEDAPPEYKYSLNFNHNRKQSETESKLTSPRKNFLKKTNQSASTNNLKSKYSQIDIEDLWNEAKPAPLMKKTTGGTSKIAKVNAKEYIKSLKETPHTGVIKMKNKDKDRKIGKL